MKRISMGLSVLLMTAVLLMGCAKAQPISKSDFVLDTIATITVYNGGTEEILNETFELCRYYERLFSVTKEKSDIGRINLAKGQKVTVSQDTLNLFQAAVYYGDLTDGAFDVTIYPVSRLWDYKSEEPKPPSDGEIQAALAHVDYRKIEIFPEESAVRLMDPEAMVDLGGIAKGYIADRLKDYLLSKGVEDAIINLGGNVVAMGSKSEGEAFRIGLQKPFSDTGEVLTTVEASDLSVVSSGSYERYFYYKDKLYHHILDPKTGYPADSGLNGVTILSEKSMDGDALSTSCFVLGEKAGQELLQKLNQQGKTFRAIFVDKKNEFHKIGFE
ncbi:MAG: FAD:protein FMN transferase [Lachnospiraceae bacterium]|nr:FAD:protein FMN transferase [Lachnospiraceae bacterium]